MPEILIHHMLTPLYPYMVKTLLPSLSDSNNLVADAGLGHEGMHGGKGAKGGVGCYAGILASSYFFPTIVGAPLMGYLSDRWGRKVRSIKKNPQTVGLLKLTW
jgi:MFS family permease